MTDQREPQPRAGLGTTAIHGGDADNRTHAHMQPIWQSSTYLFDSVAHGQALWRGEEQGYIYSRLTNPNSEATANTIAALEGLNLPQRPFALLTGSGMAAVSTVLLGLTQAGDTILVQQSLYGGTHGLLKSHLPRHGVNVATFDGTALATLDTALAQHDRVPLVYIETPANPTMSLTDIRGAVARAHTAGALAVIDNTFATPYNQRPLEMGIDVVLHSTTKYLTGHGTVVGGAMVAADETLVNERLLPALQLYGGVPGPMDAWLTGLGLKTFHLRMARHNENGLAVARFLADHPAVARVYYPGLESFPQYALAQTQMDACGGMLSFELKGGYDAGVAAMDRVQLCRLAVSLGTFDTLIQHPASMTHFTVTPEDRAQMGISDGLVRLSVGLEDVADIIADLEQALSI